MNRLVRWLRLVARWFWAGREGWGPILISVGVVSVASSMTTLLDDALRYAGLVLQVLGVITVAIGLRDRRDTFKKGRVSQLFVQWMASFPRFDPKPRTGSMSANISVSARGSAYGFAWHTIPENGTTEERLAMIQKNLDEVKQLALDTQKQMQAEASKLSSKIESEQIARAAAYQALSAKLESVGAGNLHLEEAGVFWLITGIILGTAPSEFAALVRLIW